MPQNFWEEKQIMIGNKDDVEKTDHEKSKKPSYFLPPGDRRPTRKRAGHYGVKFSLRVWGNGSGWAGVVSDDGSGDAD